MASVGTFFVPFYPLVLLVLSADFHSALHQNLKGGSKQTAVDQFTCLDTTEIARPLFSSLFLFLKKYTFSGYFKAMP